MFRIPGWTRVPSLQLRVQSVLLRKQNKVRQKPLRVILNGLGKDAAQIISRINGFTFVETEYDPYTNEVKEVSVNLTLRVFAQKLTATVLTAFRKVLFNHVERERRRIHYW